MINATCTAPSFNELFESVIERIKSYGEDPADYNVLQLMDDVMSRGGQVDQIDNGSWWLLLKNRTIEDETEVPCPEWCRYEHGHVFESETDDGLQVRYHALQLESPDGVDLSIVQEETRPKGDDSAFTRGTPTIWLRSTTVTLTPRRRGQSRRH